ncbi:uncharacterized protein FTJAE_8348 [Fusarium tjaetaba]|uniref:Uncharacterized protein n=1 Tax=Fusarium tjaetaba TaxID=1567544 RepID=A0A8H5RBH4_9HYPO|nr:uncharacterized protein FTJAE_8348 [Fusarium tjaetaba]KAF5629978.1 hypothetical protein FTJAE_8348 [Fusarium tjaetaba]
MIDTRNFPSQTFLRDIDALNCYYPYDRQPSDDELILKTFSYLFTDEELDLGEIKYEVEAKRMLYGGTSVMEELKRFQELMEMINNFSNDAVEKKEQEDVVATMSDSFVRLTTNESPNAIFSSRPHRFRRIFENA